MIFLFELSRYGDYQRSSRARVCFNTDQYEHGYEELRMQKALRLPRHEPLWTRDRGRKSHDGFELAVAHFAHSDGHDLAVLAKRQVFS